MPLRRFLARAARFIERAWSPEFPSHPEFPDSSPCWSPAAGERCWADCPACPGWSGYDAPVVVVRHDATHGWYDVRPDDDAGFVFRCYRGELSPINAAEDMVEAMRRLSAEVARP